MRVSLMITCLGDVFFPQVGMATVRLLRRLGVEVNFPSGQTCCGQPHFNSGYHAEAHAIARHVLDVFADQDLVVTPSGSCAAMVKLEYPHLFANDAAHAKQAEQLAARTYELSAFLVQVLGITDVGATYHAKATYHMACHLRGMGLFNEPLTLLKNVRGLELISMDRFDECCGFGGSFSVRFPEISGAMVDDKAKAVEATGADIVIATDAGCLMNVGGRLRRRGSPVRIVHMAEVLAGEEPAS